MRVKHQEMVYSDKNIFVRVTKSVKRVISERTRFEKERFTLSFYRSENVNNCIGGVNRTRGRKECALHRSEGGVDRVANHTILDATGVFYQTE